MLTGGLAVMTGLYTPDTITGDTSTNMSLSLGLILVGYGFACEAFAFITLFKIGRIGSDHGEGTED